MRKWPEKTGGILKISFNSCPGSTALFCTTKQWHVSRVESYFRYYILYQLVFGAKNVHVRSAHLAMVLGIQLVKEIEKALQVSLA